MTQTEQLTFPTVENVENEMSILLKSQPDYYEHNNQELVFDAIKSLEKTSKFDFDFNKENLFNSVLESLGWE